MGTACICTLSDEHNFSLGNFANCVRILTILIRWLTVSPDNLSIKLFYASVFKVICYIVLATGRENKIKFPIKEMLN